MPNAFTIGSLMYAMVCTRPNIAHVMGVVCRYISNLGKQHWEVVKRILRYLRDTIELTLCFKKSDLGLHGYVDADMDGYIVSQKSTIGHVYTLGDTTISWVSKLQKIVALLLLRKNILQ